MINPFEDIINRLERIEKLLLEKQIEPSAPNPVENLIDTKELCLIIFGTGNKSKKK